jgi:sterol desaturase/sphingolipid hydroxylase (fatty acid hydroxylase superfamily)
VLDSYLIFVCGLFAWTFVEYLIHAWLSHTFKTFATPLHEEHHRDPRAVFAIGAWIPIGVAWLGGLALFGWGPGMIFFSGMVAGFAAYEAIHYRIHFCNPLSAAEAGRRSRHLVHHYREPNASFGVTSSLWDLVFGTELLGPAMKQLCDSTATIRPLDGPSNLHELPYFGACRRIRFPRLR